MEEKENGDCVLVVSHSLTVLLFHTNFVFLVAFDDDIVVVDENEALW